MQYTSMAWGEHVARAGDSPSGLVFTERHTRSQQRGQEPTTISSTEAFQTTATSVGPTDCGKPGAELGSGQLARSKRRVTHSSNGSV